MSKLYRFAMFGRKDAGKTCILAAMSLAHVKNPQGYTVTWIPDLPSESNDPAIAKQYSEGQRLLEACRTAIEEGEKPSPNPVDTICRYRFDFTAPIRESGQLHAGTSIHSADTIVATTDKQVNDKNERCYGRKYNVEFIDYSGELLERGATAEDVANKLRSILTEMDALFILAEAPKPGQEQNRFFREFELLQQAFALLSAERQKKGKGIQTPLVMVFNKWDRLYPNSNESFDRAVQLEAFLNGERLDSGSQNGSEEKAYPPHRTLVDFLFGSVESGCFHKAAMSAFGSCRIEQRTSVDNIVKDVELPPLGRPLPSFGLEDGFIWAAQCRDEIDLNQYESDVAETPVASAYPWFWANAFNPIKPMQLWAQGKGLVTRFPKGSQAYMRSLKAQARSLKVGALRTVSTVLLLGFMLFSMETIYDLWQIRRARMDVASGETTASDLKHYRGVIQDYIKAPDYRHMLSRLIISKSETKDFLDTIDKKYESSLWAPVQKLSPNALSQEPLAKMYIAELPNGEHAAEARSIIRQSEIDRNNIENLAHLKAVRDKIDRLRQGIPKLEDIVKVEDQVAKLPYQTDISEVVKQEQVDIRRMLGDLVKTFTMSESEKKLVQELKSGDYHAAAQIGKSMGQTPEGKELAALIMISHSSKAVDEARRVQRWNTISGLYKTIKQSWVDTGLLNSEHRLLVLSWEKIALQGEDAKLYEDVKQYRNVECCNKYLSSVVPKQYQTMRREVEEFQTYLSKSQVKLDLTFVVKRLTMGTRTSMSGRFRCEVRIVNVGTLSFESKNWAADQSYDDPCTDRPSVALALEDNITLDISLYTYDNSRQYDLGKEIWTGKVKELVLKEIELPITEHYKSSPTKSKLQIELKGLLEAPPLPSYKGT